MTSSSSRSRRTATGPTCCSRSSMSLAPTAKLPDGEVVAASKRSQLYKQALPNGVPFKVFLDPPDGRWQHRRDRGVVGHHGGARVGADRSQGPHPRVLRQQARLGVAGRARPAFAR